MSEPQITAPGPRRSTAAARYAQQLLAACGRATTPLPRTAALDPGLDARREWARSGAMALTGDPEGAPRAAPGPLALAARGAALAVSALAPDSKTLAELDGPALLGERAALLGLARQGSVAPGGSCRLLATRDGWLALNLPRVEDRELLPAWLETPALAGEDSWAFAGRALEGRPARAWVERGRLMGLALAEVGDLPANPEPWLRIDTPGRIRPAPVPGGSRPRVVDLSSLWAGPLCASLLAASGGHVVKVESIGRPDGARRGSPEFFDLMNAGKASVALDLDGPPGIRELRSLIAQADIVIESARPRALAHLGVEARTSVRSHPGQVWVSITGHGRAGERGLWAGLGDDAAVAAGAVVARDGQPLFCGDAIADPLTGLHAAAAALAFYRAGRGALLDISLSAVTRAALVGPERELGHGRVGSDDEGTIRGRRHDDPDPEEVAAPRARTRTGRARALGADNARVLGAEPVPASLGAAP